MEDLKTVINSFPNSLVIIHKRHLQNKDILDILKNSNHFVTPANCNDDLFILLAYLKKINMKTPCKILTNDKYSDHTFINNDFRFHVIDDTVNYTNNKGILTFDKINSFSNCIQIIEDDIYLPTNSKNEFFTIKKNE